eukprot:438235-Pyramimonas_sp.AAC.2
MSSIIPSLHTIPHRRPRPPSYPPLASLPHPLPPRDGVSANVRDLLLPASAGCYIVCPGATARE